MHVIITLIIVEMEVQEEALQNNDLPIPSLPTFFINGKEYLLLHDIWVLFNLRENYALGAIAQGLDREK